MPRKSVIHCDICLKECYNSDKGTWDYWHIEHYMHGVFSYTLGREKHPLDNIKYICSKCYKNGMAIV